jgi:ketosteroid isomerase-like protein
MESMITARSVLIVAVLLATQNLSAQAEPAPADSAAVASTVRAYHEALARGDSTGALRLLASDAVILENGGRETREEYRSHHLPADIQFAQAVPTRLSALQVTLSGDVAWASSTSVTQGTYRERAINSTGAELMVLSRTSTGWVIRAIHWSSRTPRSGN